jgi:hypothetical protein
LSLVPAATVVPDETRVRIRNLEARSWKQGSAHTTVLETSNNQGKSATSYCPDPIGDALELTNNTEPSVPKNGATSEV